MLDERFQRGSLLLEIGFTLIAIGVMAGLATSSLNGLEQARQDSRRAAEIRLAKDALKAFMLKSRRLPCPDMTGTGWEGDAAGQCPIGTNVGRLPYVSLNLPLPDGSQFLRYGVWRSAGFADYVLPLDRSTGGISAGALVSVSRAATASAAGPGQPYVAGLDSEGRAGNCSSPSVNPAYVLMFVTPDTTNSSNLFCFFETSASSQGLAFVGHDEILGWAASQLRY